MKFIGTTDGGSSTLRWSRLSARRAAAGLTVVRGRFPWCWPREPRGLLARSRRGRLAGKRSGCEVPARPEPAYCCPRGRERCAVNAARRERIASIAARGWGSDRSPTPRKGDCYE